MNNMHILALLASSHCFMEALFQRRSKSENGGGLRLMPCCQSDKSPLSRSDRVEELKIFQHRRRFSRFTPRKGHGCFDMLSMSTPEQGFTQVRQGSKIQKYPWHWRSEHVWTEYLPTPTCHGDAMAKYVMVPLRLRYFYIMLLWCDAVGTHSTCVEVWQQLDEHSIIHESTIGQICQFANALGFGTQVI